MCLLMQSLHKMLVMPNNFEQVTHEEKLGSILSFLLQLLPTHFIFSGKNI